ncbi:GNAT family N-acetyltransferase [Mucilaginibacter agri]|uniref:GNAT family N-acetyltransferase n=1 Tax=Mucilaginibacter agri TaxID=2695265 RepID=A0A966DVN3_9SPHI|nr:GNAT family N-acetyltransferase [Mucilaginibacter agri]NCD71651.1 GNAT family N-acetyltransferase [Mucilaginibacter agri]
MKLKNPPYPNFPVLTSEDIILRSVTAKDAVDIMDISFYDGIPAASPEEAIQMQERINEDYQQGNTIHWGIVDAQTSKLVGTCGYYRGFANYTGELGYVLKPAFYGKGYMTRALKLAIDFGLDTIGLQKIIAVAEKGNIKSKNVLKRLGFVEKLEDAGHLIYIYRSENDIEVLFSLRP